MRHLLFRSGQGVSWRRGDHETNIYRVTETQRQGRGFQVEGTAGLVERKLGWEVTEKQAGAGP